MTALAAAAIPKPRLTDHRGALAYAIACFFVWGLAYGLLDVLNKHVQETLHVGKANSAWLSMAYFGAYLTLSFPAGKLVAAIGYRRGLATGLAITACGALLFIPAAQAGKFSWFVGAMYVLAGGLCVLETTADTYVNGLGDPSQASRRLTLGQSFNGVGVFVGPLIGGLLLFGNVDRAVQIIYAVIAFLVLLFAGFVLRADLPEIGVEGHHETGPAAGKLRHSRHYVLGLITQFLYIGAQVGVGFYFINLVTETWRGTSSQEAAYLLSVATLFYLGGRFAGTWLMGKVGAAKLLLLYAIGAFVCCIVVSLGLPVVSACALVGVLGFESIMFPTIFGLAVRDLGAQTGRGASIMVMMIGGGVVLPYPMGLLAQSFGTPVAYLLPAACFVLVGLYAQWGHQLKDAT